jgi:hypothetical protein
MANMLKEWQAQGIREVGQQHAVSGERLDNLDRGGQYIEYGCLELVTATGRATCKECGQKIAKGMMSLRFYWDFKGSGSWTAQASQIHFLDCPAV